MLLRKARCYAEIYNDLDGEIVNLFRVLRDRGAELREQLALTPFAREEYAGAYEPTEDPVERARRTVIKSYQGFGSTSTMHVSGFRANSNRSHTTPAHDWANYPACIPALVDRLQGVVIEQRPAGEVIAAHDSPSTLIYVDPPYVHGTRSQGNTSCIKHKYRHEMTDDDHRALAEQLHEVEGMVVLSGYPSPLYDCELYPDWERVERQTMADGARPRQEVVWINPACAEALRRDRSQKILFVEAA